MSAQFPRPSLRLAWLLSAALLLAGALPTQATIRGGYLSASGDTLVLSLSVPTGAPALIVEQTLAGGNRVESTAPAANKSSSGGTRLKWLFKNVRAGNITLTTRLSAPLKGGVSATVRYNQPGGGQFTELHIRP